MADLVSFADVARDLGISTQEVTQLVSSGELETGEEGGLVMVTRESFTRYRSKVASAPIKLSDEEPPAAQPIALAPDEDAGQVEEVQPAASPEVPGEKTESIFGDEGFELETFEEAEAPGSELADLEEAGEEVGEDELAEMTSFEAGPARRRGAGAPSQTSTAITVMAVLTFIILLFGGIVIFNFTRNMPQKLVRPITDSLPIGGGE
jgi:hypothetical protein